MPITHTDYVPILKWRQGEYQALWRLADATKDRTVPLIEITPPDFDWMLTTIEKKFASAAGTRSAMRSTASPSDRPRDCASTRRCTGPA